MTRANSFGLVLLGEVLLGVVMVGQPGRSRAETLAQAMASAWATNPDLGEARARQESLEETPELARAEGRLTADAQADAGYDRTAYGRFASGYVSADLALWTGGRVASAVRAASHDVAAGAQDLRDAQARVLESVVTAYAELLYNQQAVDVARLGIKRLDQHVAEARSRFELGHVTRTDVAQIETQRATVAASLAEAQGVLERTQSTYRALVGHDPGNLDTPSVAPPLLPASRDEARAEAMQANPTLIAQHEVLEAARAQIGLARSQSAPRIGLSGRYGPGLARTGDDWRGYVEAGSVGVTLKVPLLTGGLVSAHVRQAEATWRAERFQADAARRNVERRVDTAWANLTAARSQLELSLEGQKSAETALNGTRAEYGFGLRSTTDILLADQNYRSRQLSVARARTDVLIAQAALLRATGHLEPDAFR